MNPDDFVIYEEDLEEYDNELYFEKHYCKECEGYTSDWTDDNGHCAYCAYIYQPIEHVGYSPERAKIGRGMVGVYGVGEYVYSENWKKECSRRQTASILDLLLEGHGKVTQRDAHVAATVIQWLGTNVGSCFVDECLKETKKITDAVRHNYYEDHKLEKELNKLTGFYQHLYMPDYVKEE